ncbi:MAG: hypothetical protein IPL65_00175 [Lewinellaceae bacterium]|nr:hypothetical protein [Lewinellaceae bacterium]
MVQTTCEPLVGGLDKPCTVYETVEYGHTFSQLLLMAPAVLSQGAGFRETMLNGVL